MANNLIRSDAVHFEYDGSNPAAALVTVYRAGGTTTVDLSTLATGLYGLAVTDIDVVTDTAGTVTVFDGSGAGDSASNVAGRRVISGNFSAQGGLSRQFSTPRFLPPGRRPLVTGTGAIRVVGTGFLYRTHQ